MGIRGTFFWAANLGVLALAAGLVSCSGGSAQDPAAGGGTSAAAAVSGAVHGGQQPVSGSQVTAYTPGNGGFGSAAVALACVKTNASGDFSFGGPAAIACTSGPALPTSFSCPSASCPLGSSLIYLAAAGGNPGLAAGTNNTALALMAVLGPYNQTSSSAFVNLTELSTVAATYALAQMMGATSTGCIDCGSGLAGRLQGALDIGARPPWLGNAFSRAKSLVTVSTSTVGAALPAPATCTGSTSQPLNCVAEEKLDSLADALAACVNTAGPTSSACVKLFCVATPGATSNGAACTPPAGGAVAADTLQSALSIALNPSTVPASGIYSLIGATPPFTPTLGSVPPDWMLALNFTGGGLNEPFGIAIDGIGNVWLANHATDPSDNSSVTELNSNGLPLSPSTGYTGGGLSGGIGIAIDAGGSVWVANNGVFGKTFGNGVSELNSSGVPLSPSGGYTGGGLLEPNAIAIDSSGHIWVTNQGSGSITELNGYGTPLSPSSGYTGGGSNGPNGIAIDGSGNIWAGNLANDVTELSDNGQALSPSGGYTAPNMAEPVAVAIDPAGNVWVANGQNSSITELNDQGAALSPAGGYTGGGLSSPRGLGIAIDAGGNVWVANNGNGSVTELSSSGAPLSPSTGYSGGGLNQPNAIALDGSGNVWVANNYNGVTELVGIAVPVKTPLIGPPQSP